MIMESEFITNENALKEIFSLFCSVSRYERKQIYDSSDYLYFMNTDLSEEYSLTEETREFSFDALRAVLFFLHSRGFELSKDGDTLDLSFVEELFVD